MNPLLFSVFDKRITSNIPTSKSLPNISQLILNNFVITHNCFNKDNEQSHIFNNGKLVCVFNGRLDNITDLCKRFNISNDENINHVIAQLYLKQGESLGSILKGNFLYFIWDENLNKLICAIDSFNANQLFYFIDDKHVFISTDAKALSTQPAFNKLKINQQSLSGWLNGQPNPAGSMFEQIKSIPNGFELSIHFKNQNHSPEVSLQEIWDINPNKLSESNSELEVQEQFYALLNNSIKNKIQHHKSVTTQMSGGLDSTSVSALANKYCLLNDITHHTVSHTYKATNSCNEIALINEMINSLGTHQSHFIELDQYQDLSFAELYPNSFNNPGVVFSPKYTEELRLISSLGCNLLLTGNGGDEVCWGHSATYRTRLYKGEFGVIPEVLKACKPLNYSKYAALKQVFIKPALLDAISLILNKHTKVPVQNSPNWLTNKSKALVNESMFKNPYNFKQHPDKYYRYHSIKTTSTYNSMRSYQSIANQFDIDVFHPFFDQDIVEFSFAVPQRLLIQGAYPKWLLRKSMTNILPKDVCWNIKKTVFDQHFANLIINNADELRALLAHEGLQDLGLICNKTILAEFNKMLCSKTPSLNVDMLYAILTQQWFQTHIAQ